MNTVPQAEEIFAEALELVDSYSKRLLARPGNTWGPRYVKVMARLPGVARPLAGTLGFVQPWDRRWGEHEVDFAPIAANKLEQAVRARGYSRTALATQPWQLRGGDYLAAGGVAEPDGSLAVGVSGAYGWVDEAIAGALLVTIRHLYHSWMAGLQDRGAQRLEPVGEERP